MNPPLYVMYMYTLVTYKEKPDLTCSASRSAPYLIFLYSFSVATLYINKRLLELLFIIICAVPVVQVSCQSSAHAERFRLTQYPLW